MDSRHFGQQFVAVQLGEAVIVVNPCHQFCKRDAQAVIQWPVGAHGHDCIFILKAWPADLLSFDHVDLQPPTQWDLNCRTCHFAVAHSGMPISHVELRSQHIYGKVDGVAGTGLRRVHVAAESLRHDGTACLPARWCHADTTKERMQRNLHRCCALSLVNSGDLANLEGVGAYTAWVKNSSKVPYVTA